MTDATSEQSLTRRFFARFGLVAFALYHVPLFLNNYPSLGGGGFDDHGLALRWGHVFTPPFVWLARHLFHMTGPMTGAYQGDNGDVGEEFARLLLSIGIGAIAAIAWTAADRRRPGARWVDDALKLLLRYSIALGLVSYAIAKIVPQQFPPLTLSDMEDRLGEMAPMSVLWRFMETSRAYALFGGVAELVAVVLLCFRRTATLGALVCIAVMTNVAALNWFYGVPVKLYSTMLVVSAVALALFDARRLIAVFVTNRGTAPAPLASSIQDRFSPAIRWTTKTLLVGSVLVSSWIAMAPTLSPAPGSGLDGSWYVTSMTRGGASLDATADPARWRRVLANEFSVSIRLETDSLVRCGRAANGATGVKLQCARKHGGEITWTRAGDTLHIDGIFDGAPVAVTAARMDSTRYPLLRTKFRLITDR